jgi:hypothetical protein
MISRVLGRMDTIELLTKNMKRRDPSAALLGTGGARWLSFDENPPDGIS